MRPRAVITKADASRLLEAAHEAGYSRARLVAHPDGKIELVAETREPDAPAASNDWDKLLT